MTAEEEKQKQPKPSHRRDTEPKKPLPTNLGYGFGQVEEGILLLISELKAPLPRGGNVNLKYDREKLKEYQQKAVEVHNKMLPTLDHLLTKGNLPNDTLTTQILEVKKFIEQVLTFTEKEELTDSSGTIKALLSIIDRRFKREKQSKH